MKIFILKLFSVAVMIIVVVNILFNLILAERLEDEVTVSQARVESFLNKFLK